VECRNALAMSVQIAGQIITVDLGCVVLGLPIRVSWLSWMHSVQQYIHSKGYIHRVVKSDNLLMGVGTQGNTVYTTDIGLGKEIEDPDRRTYSIVGTLRYASINAHLGKVAADAMKPGLLAVRLSPCGQGVEIGVWL
jgi:serine/threonine protein kinase